MPLPFAHFDNGLLRENFPTTHGKGAGCVGNLPLHRCPQTNVLYYIKRPGQMQEKVGILPGFSFSHYIIYIATGGLIFPRSTGSPFPDPVSPRPARPFERPRPIHRPMQITSRECSPKLPSRRRHDGCGASRPSPSRLKKRGGARTCPHFSAPAPEAARGQAPSTRTRSPKCSVGPPSTVRVPEKRIPHPKRAIPPIRPQQPPAMGMSSESKGTGST